MASIDIPVGLQRSLRSLQLSEAWLQERIFNDPSILGLGDLVAVKREKAQVSGGRLDILLKDSEDNSMYEVEVMLGATDETHIIRTIEYWDFERRQYPQRQHYAVLVAESFNRRFFNVIQLLSAAVPIIAIQVSVVEVGGATSLVFTKVLDLYAEPEDEAEEGETVDAAWWQKKADWVLVAARDLLEQTKDLLPDTSLVFIQSAIVFRYRSMNLLWLKRRARPEFRLEFRADAADEIKLREAFAAHDLAIVKQKSALGINIQGTIFKQHRDIFRQLAIAARRYRIRTDGEAE